MARLSALNLPPSARKRFSFMRKARDGAEVPCEVLLQILTPKEFDIARAEAVRFVKRMIEENDEKNGQSFEELLVDARIYETLQYALRDPEFENEANPPPWCTSMELREILTTVEVGIVWRAYCMHEQWLGPVKHELTQEEYEAMIMIAASSDSLDPEELFGARLRAKCHHRMASEILSLRLRLGELEKAATVPPPNFDEILGNIVPRSDAENP